jgi:hypothetical protein
MLVYNNKLLKVGGKALLYMPPPPTEYSASYAPDSVGSITSGYSWWKTSTEFHSSFGDNNWKVSSNGQKLYTVSGSGDNDARVQRSRIGTYRRGLRFDRTKALYLYPCLYQMGSTGVVWILRASSYVGTLSAGSSGTDQIFFNTNLNGVFSTHIGTYDPTLPVDFSWIAFVVGSISLDYYGMVFYEGANKYTRTLSITLEAS